MVLETTLRLYNPLMSNLRRYYIPNSMVFITTVTEKRHPIFQDSYNINTLLLTIDNVRKIHPFTLTAFVILPDHLHLIIQLPEQQPNFSSVIKSIKGNFTANYKKENKLQGKITIWQKRFWDHVIRDEGDLKTHLDYIHWNPVKHHYVNTPEAWAYSSFNDWIEKGVYPPDWGKNEEPPNIQGLSFE